MEQYADLPMDLADASLVTAAEAIGMRHVFAIDRKAFAVYRVRRGHRNQTMQMVL
jgi:predicted nucleic acid-binding protein